VKTKAKMFEKSGKDVDKGMKEGSRADKKADAKQMRAMLLVKMPMKKGKVK